MIDLPSHPAPAAAQPALIDFGGFLSPALGGPIQRIERMGNRFRISVTMPPMPSAKLGRSWVRALIQGKQEGARMAFPMMGFEPGFPGNVLVNGASQSGRTLVVDGTTPNYVFREGQFFSIVTNGKHHLHMVTAEVIANASGQATLPIEPMLRVPPANNDVCHFANPMIEGFIIGDEQAWSMGLGNFISLGFDLVERE